MPKRGQRCLVVRSVGGAVVLALVLASLSPLSAEEFNIAIGSSVTEGEPAPGAGRLSTSTESDFYTFVAEAGELGFFEALDSDPAFRGSLRWQLTGPSGALIFSSFFTNARGRTLLGEAGLYRIRVFTDGRDASWVGTYSFRILSIPPDQTFAFALGGRVADGNPAAGAGRLEAAGAEDYYLFTASQGQLAFFAPSGVDPAFKGALRWQLIKPSGGTVFASFFSNPQGRTLLPETGAYRIRVYTDGTDPSWLGWYGFEVLALPPDQTFTYSIGTTVTDGAPQTGAGRLEVAGAEDNYLFTASAGQVVFFQSLTQDPTFKGGLRWQLADPAGGTVFSSLFNNPQGRVILGKAGQYRIRIFTDGREPGAFGTYSFSTRSDVADQQFAIQVGQLVSDSRPAPGAGRIETPGSEDTYTFAGREGQVVIFESIDQAPGFAGNLRWQLVAPSGVPVFGSLFTNPQGRSRLPEAGSYRLRVFTGGADPAWTGEYSFRLYSPVHTRGDSVFTEPNKPTVIPVALLLCNDLADDPDDVLTLVLPSASSVSGGTLALTQDQLSYSPAPGFTGADSFVYRLEGKLGGVSETVVRVLVAPGASQFASIVGWNRHTPTTADLCMLGEPGGRYLLETSQTLGTWTPATTLQADQAGVIHAQIDWSTGPDHQFVRARRLP